MASRVLLMGPGACIVKATLGASARGLAVEIVASQEEGIERARLRPPEVVVIEGTDDEALEMVESLAEDPRTESLPLLVLGDTESVTGADRMMALGARLVPASEVPLRHAIDETLALHVHLRGLRAVVADDDPAVTRLLGELLRSQGCRVDEAHDGDAAHELLLASVPDLVVTDLLMPGMRGEELVRRMREDAVLRDVPVVLLSWKDDWLTQARARGVEVSGFLTKRAAPQTALTTLRAALATRRSLEARLASESAARGQLDELTPHRLLCLVSRLRRDSRVSVRDGANLYDVQLRAGAPRAATRVSSQGSVIRGPVALDALLRLREGRFVVAVEKGPVQCELEGSLAAQLEAHVARLRSPTTGPIASVASVASVAPVASAAPVTPEPLPAPVAYFVSSPPATPDTVTQPLFARRAPEPVQITVRLPMPPPRPNPASSSAAPPPGPSPMPERTLPLPYRPVSAPPVALPAIPPPARWRPNTGVILRTAAVLVVAACGLAVGGGLRVWQCAQDQAAANATSAPPAR